MSLSERIKAQTLGTKTTTTTEQLQEPVIIETPKKEPIIETEVELSPLQVEARTKESLEDEVKSLREENAKRRKKEQEAKEKALATAEEIFKAEREEYEANLAKMKEELKALKDLKKQEQKIDTEIKADQSNAEIDDLRQQMLTLKAESDAAKKLIEEQQRKEEEEKSLRKQAAENRLKSLLTEIPEEFREDAQAMFRGYSDPSEGLLAISRAKTKGLFSKKTIEVVNHVPGDNTNNNRQDPRSRKTKMRDAISERRKGLAVNGRII